MCGRYYVDFDELPEAIAEEWGLDVHGAGTITMAGASDITPGTVAPALLRDGRGFVMKPMRWGFEGPEVGLVINARVETIREKPMYRAIQSGQRCVLPAFHYYEWRGGDRQKYEIGLTDRPMFFLAGLYRIGRQSTEFVVLTQPPLQPITPIHNRMPLLLDSVPALKAWLDGGDARFLDEARLRIAASGPEQLQMML